MPRVRRSSQYDLEVNSENDWKIKKTIQGFILDDIKIHKLQNVLTTEMERGLSKDKSVRVSSSLQMEVSYVRDILDGSERGSFLALDLGGTNFRVLYVTLLSGSRVTSILRHFEVTRDKLTSTAESLFKFIAECIDLFIREEKVKVPPNGEKMPLGFTFSFPMEHNGINSGTLVRWTKNFQNTTGVGLDAAELLQNAVDKIENLNIEVVALLNDTVGTLMSGALLDSNCLIGLILGTGSNVCYMERLSNVPKYSPESMTRGPQQVIIDMEWGAFGDNGSIDFLKTDFDKEVDKISNHVGTFTFEKLFSGLYLGELARLTLLKLCEEGLVFDGKPSERLQTRGGFPTSFISRIESDNHRDLSNTHRILRELSLEEITDEDYHVVRYLANVLSVRAAQIIAAGLTVVIKHMRVYSVTVAVDGSLYRHHPKLCTLIQEYINIYLPAAMVSFIESDDGSGKGAAFTAAVACRLRDAVESGDDDESLPSVFDRQFSGVLLDECS